ncbi:MAG: hypothetical protein ACFFG0_51440 [Candidatus Thorarchaeota archaeon]
MSKFKHFKQLYQDNKFDVLLKEKGSIYWLKLRSISRKELLVEFCMLANIDYTNVRGAALFEHIYDARPKEELLDKFITQKYSIERAERKTNEKKLVSELYKMKVLDWGGIYQNNLEKSIVNNYIKKIKDFALLNKKIDNEIHASMRGYVQSSWFNHWTSILIEDIFKDNKKVLPTVGLIKKVDFFISNIPFDLKVTYFPEGYMFAKRKALGLPTEIQLLKGFAKTKGIQYDKTQKDKILMSELLTRISERTDVESKRFIKEFKKVRWKIVEDTIKDKKSLIKWLYEKQGERRFDAANRLFLVLIDKKNMEESWKMKRNIELLVDKIDSYLNKFNARDRAKLDIEFDWIDGKKYKALSDVIFLIR